MGAEVDVARAIIGAAMKVHRTLGPGFLESVYQKALAFELRREGLSVEEFRAIGVWYEGESVGEFVTDMLVNDEVIIENKAVRALIKAHEVQLVNYLTATRKDVGVLLNFGAQSLEYRKRLRQLPSSPNSVKFR